MLPDDDNVSTLITAVALFFVAIIGADLRRRWMEHREIERTLEHERRRSQLGD